MIDFSSAPCRMTALKGTFLYFIVVEFRLLYVDCTDAFLVKIRFPPCGDSMFNVHIKMILEQSTLSPPFTRFLFTRNSIYAEFGFGPIPLFMH